MALIRPEIHSPETSTLDSITHELNLALTNLIPPISEEDKLEISNAIKAVKYPYSIQNLLVYLDKITAEKLKNSAHPALKEWGEKCVQFYQSDLGQKFVDSATGNVMTPSLARSSDVCFVQGGFSGHCEHFSRGNGVWHILEKRWVPSPASHLSRSIYRTAQEVLNIMLYNVTASELGVILSPMNPPNMSTSPFKLISPLHVAAMLGDIPLIQNLIDQGFRADDCMNEWKISPLEFALKSEQTMAIDFFLTKMAAHLLQQPLKYAVANNSFAIITKLLEHAAPLTDETISLGRSRNPQLGKFLEIKRKQKYEIMAIAHSPLKALNEMLTSEIDCDQLLIDLFKIYPEVINTIENEADGNTLLHKLVISKELNKIKILLAAIFHAQYCDIERFIFDINKKNKA